MEPSPYPFGLLVLGKLLEFFDNFAGFGGVHLGGMDEVVYIFELADADFGVDLGRSKPSVMSRLRQGKRSDHRRKEPSARNAQ